jgi:N-acetyl-gamma-glutamyl-phosphate reductase
VSGSSPRSVLIFGASGYTGLELLRWLDRHPAVELVGASSDRFIGQPIGDQVPGWRGELCFESPVAIEARASTGMVAFLATPSEVSLKLAPVLLARGLLVIDLSGAFRLTDPAAYPRWYGFAHDAPALLREAHYGLPELFGLGLSAGDPAARLVANPGCYATAAALAVAPLLGLLDPAAPLILDGKSGTTGAGRKAEESLLYSEVADTVRPYRLTTHQHTPEIERVLSEVARRPITTLFTPHLVPMRRGLIVSAYLREIGRAHV